jgi:hypothetical protein
MIRQKISKILGPPDYRTKLISGWQQTNDIINAISSQHRQNLPEAAKIKHLFDAGNERDTARKIHHFLRNEMQYRVEPGSRQTTKTLRRFIADGYGDCKHFAIFANTILDCCGYRPCYRYAGYKKGGGLVHTYTYLPDSDTILDAVLPGFDTEKTPYTKKDIPMSLYQISGVDEIGKVNFTKIKQNVAKAQAKTSNVVAKAVKEIPNAAKKLQDGSAKISMAVPRNAFLAVVKLNGVGLATSLNQLIQRKGISALKFWETLGGELNSLEKVIKEGATKKRILGPEEEQAAFSEVYGGYSGDGVYIGEPVTIAASLASAAPILLKVKDVLMKAGIKPEDVAKVAKAAKQASSDFEKITGKKVTDVVFKKDAGQSSDKLLIKSEDIKPLDKATAEKVVTAAVANATGTDIETIKEIKTAETATSSFDTSTPVTMAPSAPMPLTMPVNLPVSPFPMPLPGVSVTPQSVFADKKTLMYVGGAALLIFLLMRK